MDPGSGLAVYAHFSRVSAADPSIWEGALCVVLPDGELLLSRSSGSEHAGDVARAGALSYTCVTPPEKWRLELAGMAQRVRTTDLAAGRLVEGPVEPLRVSLDLLAVLPVWSSGTVTGQDWGHLHLEQACRFTGSVTAAGVQTPSTVQGRLRAAVPYTLLHPVGQAPAGAA